MISANHSTDQAAKDLIETCGYAAAALTLLPIPGSEIVAVMPLHVGMIVRLGDLHGVRLERQQATELMLRIGATVGLSLVGSRIATTLAKAILPGLGGIVAAPFMYASTLALGQVAQVYFAQGGLDDAAMRDIYRDVYSSSKKDFDPKRARSTEAKTMARETAERSQGAEERLQRLEGLYNKGLIDQQEYDARRAEILAEL
jgi:uncharacterized protein (DUF697 family)